MKKNYSLIFIICLCFFMSGYGQGSETFSNLNAPTGSYGNGSYTGDNGITWTYDGARTVTTTYNITGTTIGFGDSGAGTRNVSATTDANGVGDLNYSVSRYFTGGTAADRSIEVYVNGILYDSYTLVAEGPIYTRSFTANETGSVLIEFRSVGSRQIVIDDVSWTVACTDAVDFERLVSPAVSPDTITEGSPFNVTTLATEPGVTGVPGGAPNLEAWIGYSTTDNDPSTSSGWTWVTATYSGGAGNTDEHTADIGSSLAPGTYYYASRHRLNGCGYTYGGDVTATTFWNNDSQVLIVEPDQVDFCNLQSPATGTQVVGGIYNVYARAYEPGETPAAGASPNISAWIGFNTTDATSLADFTDPSWTWVPATYQGQFGNDDEYVADIGASITTGGTYYYVSRFQLNGSDYSYGGITPPNGGNFWDGSTYISGVLTMNFPPPADVVITEIMYNTSGTDDEWIEICNVSGSSQTLNNYTIEVDGTTEFTFPSSGVVLADGDCITISLGDSGDATFNPDCPFTPDYTNGSGTGTLNNTSDTIALIASDGSTTVDSVTYDDGDGADGTGESLHVVDTSLDNSVTSSNYWEVLNGGSPGINSLISPCTPVGPEINLEGNTGNFPDISDADVTPSIFDGTDFGDVNVGSDVTNSFRIENFGGTQDLTVSGVTVLSGDTGDFSITTLPSSPIAPADPNGFSIFEVQFLPSVPGTRTAVIQITNNDSDENPYTFTVTGNGLCVASAFTASPSFGPVNTIVTVTGTNLATATASFNGLAATVNNISATEMEVTVPAGATTGNLEIIDSLGCPGSIPFTVADSEISSCEGSGGTVPTDLFISEVTDATLGGLTYVELFNGTGAGINIDNYSIEVIANGSASASAFNIFDLENITIASGSTYVIAIGRQDPPTSTNACTSVTGGSGELANSANAQFTSGGINKKTNEHDVIRLVNSGVTVDEFGVYQDDDWMDSTSITGDRGFNFRRLNTASQLPDPTFTLAELGNWTVIDWVGSGSSSCSGNDYSDIGLFDFSTGTPPVVNSISVSPSACNEVTISVSATEGFSGGNMLEYHWYYYNPAQSGLEWQTVVNGGIYTTATNSPNLIISDANSVTDYQFYCEVRENDATCYTASDAISITISTATWDGTNWIWNDGTAIDTLPTLSTNVILAGNFTTANTGLQQSFSACNLTINDGATLIINDGHYVQVENNLTVNNSGSGGINIEPQGSFVQINDNGAVNADVATNLTVSKLTAPSNHWYEYTYWSSPVFEETPAVGLAASNPNRRFQYNAQYYRDSTHENNNDNTINNVPGVDDVDDQAPFDWDDISTTFLIPGVGYASTHDPATFASTPGCPGVTCRIRYTFSGLFNNGIITVPLYRNDTEPNDNNWNLVGNPYPSAIDADLFLNTNMGIIDESIPEPNPIVEGAIYLWSQNTAPSGTENGNENLNFSQSDYAIINGTGQTAAQDNGGDSTMPTRHIPSGQSFFIAMNDGATSTQVLPSPVAGEDIQTANITFNNAMRVTGNNNQFFRTTASDNRLWINLSTDNGAFSQVLIGYLENATDGYDGMYYDAPRNGSVDTNTSIYTTIPNMNKGYTIQGKNSNSLTLDETIPLGFSSSIDEATIYTLSIPQFEGDFMSSNPIYLIDRLNNSIHELSNSEYAFTSESGNFTDRFEIVFRADALSIKDEVIDANALTIVELPDGNIKIKVASQVNITNVRILDILGREVYNLFGDSSEEIYNLSKLSNAAYIAEVTLSNGQIISKKAIKQK